MQHFKFVNWRIHGFVFWCHEQVKSFGLMIFGEAVGWAVLVRLCCFLSSFWFYFSMSMLFSFLLSRGFLFLQFAAKAQTFFFSLIFPLFFHFDGPFPLKIDIELMLFKRIYPWLILKNNETSKLKIVLPDHIGITD